MLHRGEKKEPDPLSIFLEAPSNFHKRLGCVGYYSTNKVKAHKNALDRILNKLPQKFQIFHLITKAWSLLSCLNGE